ncbi:MAG: hypothetical protein LLG04_08015 [Parachlamydia sp.]|nr:hypothetical protein [Parachlamydia sp.]
MLALKHFSRFKDLTWLLIKYGRSDIVKQMGGEIPVSDTPQSVVVAQELTADLQKLGPTFIKLGQMLSSQVEFLSPSDQESLSKLEDNVEGFPFEEIEKIVTTELGVKLKDAFLEFEREPLAAASLSQVHKAVLHSGRVVAVKVQRPGIKEKVIEDLNFLQQVAKFFDKNKLFPKHYYWEDKIKSLRTALLNELDFLKEANNLTIFAANMKEFEWLTVPLPVKDYTTARVLTMEYVSSRKITTLHPLIKMDLDGDKLSEELFNAYLKQIFIDGFVHIDPHPGNVYLTDSNQIVLLDLGMVERIPPQMQQDLLKILLALSEGKGEEVAELVIKMGHREENFQPYKFREEIADIIVQNQNLNLQDYAVGKLLLNIARCAAQNELHLPQKFTTLGKTLLNLDRITKVLSPTLNPNAFIQNNVADLLRRRMNSILTEGTFTNLLLEVSDLALHLPAKINAFLELLSKNEFKLHIQTLDEARLMRGFEKIANRIAFGMILAALIIGSTLLMSHDTTFKLFGYPGLAILFFMGASIGGLLFLFNIIINDRKSKE